MCWLFGVWVGGVGVGEEVWRLGRMKPVACSGHTMNLHCAAHGLSRLPLVNAELSIV